MSKHYPKLPKEVIEREGLMSDTEKEEVTAESAGPLVGEYGAKGREVESNPGPPPTPSPSPESSCQNDRTLPKQPKKQANSVPNEPLAPSRKEIQKLTETNLEKSLYLVGLRIKESLDNGKSADAADLTAYRMMFDLNETLKWNKKLADRILQNPSNINPPGSGQGSSLNTLRNRALKLGTTTKKDARRSSTPPVPRAVGDGLPMPE